MGYESKIIIACKFDYVNAFKRDERYYAKVYSMLDMGKVYPLSDVLRRKPETNCYIYFENCNNEVVEDCYGEPLRETTVEDAMQIVKGIIDGDSDCYFMYHVLYATLKAFKENENGHFTVLHYGY